MPQPFISAQEASQACQGDSLELAVYNAGVLTSANQLLAIDAAGNQTALAYRVIANNPPDQGSFFRTTNQVGASTGFGGTGANVKAAIPASLRDVTYTLSFSGTAIASSAEVRVLPTPRLTYVYPHSAHPGDTVRLHYTNAPDMAYSIATFLEWQYLFVSNVSDTGATAILPSDALPGKILVRNGMCQSNLVDFHLIQPTSLTGIDEATACSGDSITLRGVTLDAIDTIKATSPQSAYSASLAFRVADAQTLRIAIPANIETGTTLNLVASIAGNGVGSGLAFTAAASPVITGTTPALANPWYLNSQTGSLQLTGTAFSATPMLTLNGASIPINTGSNTAVSITVPAGQRTNGPMVLSNGTCSAKVGNVVFTGPPVHGTLIYSGCNTDSATLVVHNLVANPTLYVMVQGPPVYTPPTFGPNGIIGGGYSTLPPPNPSLRPYRRLNDTTIRFLPQVNNSVGYYVANDFGNAPYLAIRVNSRPTIASVSVTSGRPGASVAISGNEYAYATSTVYGTTNVQSVITYAAGSLKTATSTVPQLPAGLITMRVRNTTCTSTDSVLFMVLAGPVVSGINKASICSPDSVQITGSGFSSLDANTRLVAQIGQASVTPLTITVKDDGRLAAALPATLAPGAYTLSFKTGSVSTGFASVSGSGTLSVQVTAMPVVTSTTDLFGAPGTAFTVTGSGYSQSTQALLSGQTIAAGSGSATSLTFAIPAGAVSGTFVVDNGNGCSATAGNFYVIRADQAYQWQRSGQSTGDDRFTPHPPNRCRQRVCGRVFLWSGFLWPVGQRHWPDAQPYLQRYQ